MKCKFCSDLRTSETILYSNEHLTAMFDYDPISKGHLLICSTQHYLDLDELPLEVLNQIMLFARTYVKLFKKELAPQGYSIMQNGGAFNEVGHFHLHVFPRYSKKEFGWTYGETPADALNFKALIELFKKEL